MFKATISNVRSGGGDLTRRCITCSAYYSEENFVRSVEPFALIRGDWGECNGCKRQTQGVSGLSHDEFAHRYQGAGPVGESSEASYQLVERKCRRCRVYRPLDEFVRSKEPFELMVDGFKACNWCKRRGQGGDTVEMSAAMFAYRYRGGDAVDEGDLEEEVEEEVGEVPPTTSPVGQPETRQTEEVTPNTTSVGQPEIRQIEKVAPTTASDSQPGTRRCGGCRVVRTIDHFIMSAKPFGPILSHWKSCHRCRRARRGDANGLTDATFMYRFQGGEEVTEEEIVAVLEPRQVSNTTSNTRKCGSCRMYRALDNFVRSSKAFGPIMND